MPRPRGYDKHFGHHALRNLREWQGITPGELADRVVAAGGRLSAQTVRNIESGTTRPSRALLDQLLAALHSDAERLEQVRIQLIEADEERKAQAIRHLATRGLAGGDAPQAPRDLEPSQSPDSSTWSSMVDAPAAALYSAAGSPAQAGTPSEVGGTRASAASMPRPSLPAPEAPEPWEALRELGDIYSQLTATGRHALIGRARQLLATQRAADVDVARGK